MKKILFIFTILAINILSLWYLLTPIPTIPDLPNSTRSYLPGDTVQIKNVSGYFTNLSRSDVMTFYRSIYNSPLRIVINHPPERAKVIFSDTTRSYYLEEIVLPLKGSLYINGFEWENDVFTKPEKREKNKLIYEDVLYKSKVTIRTFPVSVAVRLISFFLLESLIVFLFLIYRSFLKSK